jgi:fructose-1,6-bisphosphatase II
MDKLVVPPSAAMAIDPGADTASRLNSLARALGKSVADLRIFVLNKPRHEKLVREIVQHGARVAYYSAGDVVGTCAVALGLHFDAVFGIGGTPEGMLSACAVRSLGGGFFGRLAPQKPDEANSLKEVGLSTSEWLSINDMIRSELSVFCAAGITDSPLAKGIESIDSDRRVIHSLIIEGPGKTVSRSSTTVTDSNFA